MGGMAFLKKLIQYGTSSTEVSAEGTPNGEALVAPGVAPYEEITRRGSFNIITTTATASVVAPGTTTCGLGIGNTAADGGKSIIIDALFALNKVGHATLGQSALIYVLGQTRVAALAGTLVVRKSNGYGAGADTVADCKAGGAILDAVTGVAIGWMPIGPTANMSVVSLPGCALFAPVDGRLILPPGRVMGIDVMSSNVENTWLIGAMWHERVLALG